MTAPVLILVGADKGGVGKTTILRSLLDYLKSHRVNVKVWDTEPDPGVLKRFYPVAQLVDIAKVPGQMSVFDTLVSAGVTVVDIRAGLLSPTLAAMKDTGLLEDVRQKKVTLVVIHVLDATIASLDEIDATAKLLAEGGSHILIKNSRSDDAEFFAWDQSKHDSYFRTQDAAALLSVPHLPTRAAETIESEGASFAAFADNENARGTPAEKSKTLRGYTRTWLNKTWAEFDRAEIARIAATGANTA